MYVSKVRLAPDAAEYVTNFREISETPFFQEINKKLGTNWL